MYTFTIKTIDAFGRPKTVAIEAKDPKTALMILERGGLKAHQDDFLEVQRHGFLKTLQAFDLKKYFFSVSQRDVLRLIKMIGNALSRGKTLKQSLDFIGENEDSKSVKVLINQLKDRLKKPFISQVEIFEGLPQYFDEEFLGIIHAGESSSDLGQYLVDYAKQKREQIVLYGAFQKILIQRITTFLLVVGVIIVVIIFVIPQFQSLFGDAMPIPWAMQVIVQISDVFRRGGIYIFLALFIAVTVFAYLLNSHQKLRGWWDDKLLKFPILGLTLRTYYTSRFCYLLATLLTKNVDIIQSINIIINQTNNVCMVATYHNIIQSMKSGDDLFSAIVKESDAGNQYLIPSIVQAAKVGSETATLGSTLMDVKNDLAELLDNRLKRAIKIFSAGFYAFIISIAFFIAYAIGTAVIAFYENAQNLI